MTAPHRSTLAHESLLGHPTFRHLSTVAGIRIDLRYASANNFVGRDLYAPLDCAWLHADAAAGLERSVAWLGVQAPTCQLVVLDALRPQRIQQTLWDALANTDLQLYLAEPQLGSLHSFGMALDVTLCDVLPALAGAGTSHASYPERDMGTGFDAMHDASHPANETAMLATGALTKQHLANRQVLRLAMEAGGFKGISTEWWHFDFGDRKAVRTQYPRVL